MSLSVTDMALLGKEWEESQGRLLRMLQRRIDPKLSKRIWPEDVLQETFIEAERRWPAFKLQNKVPAFVWLYGLARGRLLDFYRRETRGIRDLNLDVQLSDESSAQLGEMLAGSGTSPSGAMGREELIRQVNQLVKCLSPEDQEVLRLRYNDELQFAEIGMHLGITTNAATVRHHRVLKKLEERWNALYPEEGHLNV